MKTRNNPENPSPDSHEPSCDFAAAKKKAVRLLSLRSMSKAELIKKLTDKGFSQNTAVKAANTFENYGLINDEEYAKRLAENYSRRGYGSARVKAEMFRRGLARELTQETIDQMEDPADTIDRIIERQLKCGHAGEPELRKITNALYRRGFTWEQIRAGFRRLQIEADELEDSVE